ncbi:MAG: hypothetical protein QW589_05405 [Candidatus Bathyarchaeia archaeon]
MELESLIKGLSQRSKEEILEGLTNIVLKSSNQLSSSLAKSFLYKFQKNELTSNEGLAQLIEISKALEYEKTLDFLSKKGFQELVNFLKTMK